MKKDEKTKKPESPNVNPSETRFTFHHVSNKERYAIGKALRKKCPREAHGDWKPAKNRPDPVDLVLESDKGRIENLTPLRHGRMSMTPFTFYRGAALTMAADLGPTPNTGVYVQACGDAHLCNFGGFATPERNIIFSINDLDETLPAPWEWDVKRLAASFVVACQNNGLRDDQARDAVLNCVAAYREHMAEFSQLKTMELWHYALTSDMLMAGLDDEEMRQRGEKRIEKERGRHLSEDIFPKIVKGAGDTPIIKDVLPTIFHWENIPAGSIPPVVTETVDGYRASLQPSYRLILDRYKLKDVAIKVVGVGSVGTLCWAILFMTGDDEPLFLQAKEARRSVLEPYAGKSIYPNQGQRVINGYRLMQPFSDPFLGWTENSKGFQYFFRQLRDIKISLKVETFGKKEMNVLAGWCGQALALAHARSGDSALLSGYMGKSEAFDEALANFSFAYARQNEKDHAALKKAIREGRVEAEYDA